MKVGKCPPEKLNELFHHLKHLGYQLIGPTVQGSSITYAEINSTEDLPQGYSDFQEKGVYRLKKRQDNAYFGYNIGSRSFKNFLFPPREKLYQINQEGTVYPLNVDKTPKMALIGVRACELKAIQIQDKVFLEGNYIDQRYEKRRKNAFIISLNCHTAANTCFCVSMKTGPEVSPGYDLNLNEIITQNEHYLIIETGSQKGIDIFDALQLQDANQADLQRKQEMIQKTASMMGRTLDTTNIKEKLYQAHHHPHWEKVADRCLNCTNCTLACPTCFCSRNESTTDVEQKTTTQTKVWDSCFSQEFSYVHDTFVRSSASSRYRQWFTHKLGSWHDQFDTSGCVGCGSCITWCPVGIDITEEFLHLTTTEEKHEKNK